MNLYCAPCEVDYSDRDEIAVGILDGDSVCRKHFKARASKRDPQPQPTDGPDYHAEHAAWARRRGR